MHYYELSTDCVWNELITGVDVIACVLDNFGEFKSGIYNLNDFSVTRVNDMLKQVNVKFYKRI